MSAHRIIVGQTSSLRYAELGWAKWPDGFSLVRTIEDGTGPRTFVGGGYPSTEHDDAVQYDPNIGQHRFYVDGANFVNHPVNFSVGDRVWAGGETEYRVEGMGHTLIRNLLYLLQDQNGNFYYNYWNGYVPYVVEFPYVNIPRDPNAFYDAEVGPFLPVLFRNAGS